jgi:hypothetical protein
MAMDMTASADYKGLEKMLAGTFKAVKGNGPRDK